MNSTPIALSEPVSLRSGEKRIRVTCTEVYEFESGAPPGRIDRPEREVEHDSLVDWHWGSSRQLQHTTGHPSHDLCSCSCLTRRVNVPQSTGAHDAIAQLDRDRYHALDESWCVFRGGSMSQPLKEWRRSIGRSWMPSAARSVRLLLNNVLA